MPQAFAEWVALVAPYLTIAGLTVWVRLRPSNHPTSTEENQP
jgi:hypothetical protein